MILMLKGPLVTASVEAWHAEVERMEGKYIDICMVRVKECVSEEKLLYKRRKSETDVVPGFPARE